MTREQRTATSAATPAATFTRWRKTIRSAQEANCVEVSPGNDAAMGLVIGVRDSKDVTGPHLAFNASAWRAFIDSAEPRLRPDLTGDMVTADQSTDHGADQRVVVEFIPAEDVPAEHRKDNKVFEPGHRAIVMRDSARPDDPVLYFTVAEWEAFIGGVKNGEFDDLLIISWPPSEPTIPSGG